MIAVTAFTGDICIIQLQILHCSFEFVKAVGNTISKVQLPKDQEINGRIVKHVSGTGPLYICALKRIDDSDEVYLKVSSLFAQNKSRSTVKTIGVLSIKGTVAQLKERLNKKLP